MGKPTSGGGGRAGRGRAGGANAITGAEGATVTRTPTGGITIRAGGQRWTLTEREYKGLYIDNRGTYRLGRAGLGGATSSAGKSAPFNSILKRNFGQDFFARVINI